MTKKEIELIRKAFVDIDNYDIKRMKAFPFVQIPNVDDFDKKMLSVFGSFSVKRTISPRKLIVAILAAAIIFAMAISAYAFREPIKDFFLKKFNDEGKTYSYESDNLVKAEEGVFMPTWLPEGYKQTTHSESALKIQTVWMKNTDRIFLTQNSLTGDLTFDTEESEYEIITKDGQSYHYISKNGTISLLWMTEKYSFTLWCTNVTKEDALKIATSLEIEKEFSEE